MTHNVDKIQRSIEIIDKHPFLNQMKKVKTK